MKNKKQNNFKLVQFPILNIPRWSLSIGWQRAFRWFNLSIPEDKWEINLYSWMVSVGNIYIIKWKNEYEK